MHDHYLKLKVDHKTILVRDKNVFKIIKDFVTNNGYVKVYEVNRIGEKQTAMATFACRNLIHGECLAVVCGINSPEEPSHAQAPFIFGKDEDISTYVQHLALRTSDIFKLRSYLEEQGASFLTPIYNEKDSFGPLLQCFTRELFDDEWFFIELVQRDYNPDEVNIKLGEQFANQTVRSLYVTKQEEFRDWLLTRKKKLMFDGDPAKMRWFRDLLSSVEPYGYIKFIPALKRILK
jgi:4-hydroxyphenylpyruvate dioxygenase-like putative hemolysin